MIDLSAKESCERISIQKLCQYTVNPTIKWFFFRLSSSKKQFS